MWSLPEKNLIIELGVGIARRLNVILDSEPEADADPALKGYVCHNFTSVFEHACGVLWCLGVAHAAHGPEPERKGLSCQSAVSEKAFPPFFKFFAESDIRMLLAGEPPANAPPLQHVIDSYVGVACSYGPAGSWLPSTRKPFTPQPEYMREINVLAHLGYAEFLGTDVIWTDKIAPAMQYAYLWDADGRPIREVEEANRIAECSALLAQTPEFVRRRLEQEAATLSELDFVIVLRDRFDGLYLSKNPDGSLRPHHAAGLPEVDLWLIKRIYRTLRGET